MSTSVFILKASGPGLLFSSSVLHPICSKAFSTREAAEAFEPEFRKACVTPTGDDDLGTLEKVTRCVILELSMDDSWDRPDAVGV